MSGLFVAISTWSIQSLREHQQEHTTGMIVYNVCMAYGTYLDVSPGIEAVEFRHDLQHGALHLDVGVVVVPRCPAG